MEVINSEVQERVNEVLSETQTAQTATENILPKGNEVEKKMQAEETAAAEKKEKRPVGRPKGSYKKKKVTKQKQADGSTTEVIEESETEKPEKPDQPDMIIPAINTIVVPIVARISGKDMEACKVNEMQAREALKLMPEDANIFRPSWPAFFAAVTLAVASNAMYAPKKSRDVEELTEMKKALVKALEVEQLKTDIAKVSAQLEKLTGEMSARFTRENFETEKPFEITLDQDAQIIEN